MQTHHSKYFRMFERINKRPTRFFSNKDLPDPVTHLFKIFPTCIPSCRIKFKCLILEFKAGVLSPTSTPTASPTLGPSLCVLEFLFASLLFSQLPESPFSGHRNPHILGEGTVPSARFILGGAADPFQTHNTRGTDQVLSGN